MPKGCVSGLVTFANYLKVSLMSYVFSPHRKRQLWGCLMVISAFRKPPLLVANRSPRFCDSSALDQVLPPGIQQHQHPSFPSPGQSAPGTHDDYSVPTKTVFESCDTGAGE